MNYISRLRLPYFDLLILDLEIWGQSKKTFTRMPGIL